MEVALAFLLPSLFVLVLVSLFGAYRPAREARISSPSRVAGVCASSRNMRGSRAGIGGSGFDDEVQL